VSAVRVVCEAVCGPPVRFDVWTLITTEAAVVGAVVDNAVGPLSTADIDISDTFEAVIMFNANFF